MGVETQGRVFKSAKPGKEQTDKLKPRSGLVSGRVNTSKGRWPLVVNIGNSHTHESRDPRARGWVSSVCGWGMGVTGAMGEVVGYSGTLRPV